MPRMDADLRRRKRQQLRLHRKSDGHRQLHQLHADEMYIENRDCPRTTSKMAFENPSQWKWFLYDLDFGFNNGQSAYSGVDMFTFATAETTRRPGRTAPRPRNSSVAPKTQVSRRRSSTVTGSPRDEPSIGERDEGHRRAHLRHFEIAAIKTAGISATRMETQEATIRSFAQGHGPRKLLSEMQKFFGPGSPKAVTLSTSGTRLHRRARVHARHSSAHCRIFPGFPVLLTATPREARRVQRLSDGENGCGTLGGPAMWTRSPRYSKFQE